MGDAKVRYERGLEKLEQAASYVTRMQQKIKQRVHAEQLLQAVHEKQKQWLSAAEKMGKRYTDLIGDVLISSGVVAYLGAFTSSFRAVSDIFILN